MNFKSHITALLFSALFISGCASSINVAIKDEYSNPYGGTQLDYSLLSDPEEAASSGHLGFLIFIAYPLALIDLPLSIIGDTLTLPYTLQGESRQNSTEDNTDH